MTQDEVMEMVDVAAKQALELLNSDADMTMGQLRQRHFEVFAALIRAATKEEDAKICESMEIPEFVHGAHPDYLDGKQMAFAQAATAIRESK